MIGGLGCVSSGRVGRRSFLNDLHSATPSTASQFICHRLGSNTIKELSDRVERIRETPGKKKKKVEEFQFLFSSRLSPIVLLGVSICANPISISISRIPTVFVCSLANFRVGFTYFITILSVDSTEVVTGCPASAVIIFISFLAPPYFLFVFLLLVLLDRPSL